MNTSLKILHWTPRIFCILAILFISMFALDSFNPDLTIWQQVGAFLMHLIPSYVLIALLLVAWKWELIGGIIFALLGLGFSPIIFIHNYRMNDSIAHSLTTVLLVNVPFVLVGFLFILNHYKKRKQAQT